MSAADDLPEFDPDGATYFKKLIATSRIQRIVNKIPGLRWFARRDGEVLFDVVQGFVRSQVLFALVQLDVPKKLLEGPIRSEDLAKEIDLPLERLELLLNAGVGIGIIKSQFGRFSLTRQGAALVGVPGLSEMILHHGALYRDMEDPIALLKGESQTELSQFWPYVFGAEGAKDPEAARRYSDLMADTQGMVAQDTLQTVEMRNHKRILDVGGGSGAFCIALAEHDPYVQLDLMDLPAVEQSANERIARHGLGNRITFHPGSFRDDPFPQGADAITLIRVLYDHQDDTVEALLKKAYEALPPRGVLVISEPMAGTKAPNAITDVYFAFYTLAMRTGRTRSQAQIAEMCKAAGFEKVSTPRPLRSYVTSVVKAVKQA